MIECEILFFHIFFKRMFIRTRFKGWVIVKEYNISLVNPLLRNSNDLIKFLNFSYFPVLVGSKIRIS
jgi:hypothetical protein